MTPRVCRVQPDVPALARAFDYLVPDELGSGVSVGTVVRVGLHGRRVRGWVVADGVEPEAPAERLVPLLAVVSAGPPRDVVDLCRWVAWRWAGPYSTVLRAASPPNVVAPAAPPEVDVGVYASPAPPLPLPDVPVRSIVWPPATDGAELVASLLADEGSTIVVVPEPARAGALRTAIARDGREVVELHAGQADARRTDAWCEARRGARVVVGGRTAVFAPVPDLAALVVVDDGDEALQEERVPTWHAREVAAERARRCGARLSVVSPVPTVESVHLAGCGAPAAPDRAVTRSGWARLDVVDLRDEPPGVGLLSERFANAAHHVLDGGGRVVAVVNRRGRARLLACRTCREIARCAVCDAAVAQPARDLDCPRCHATRPPVCLACHGSTFRAVRPGVAKLRDDVAALLPKATVAEVDARTGTVPDAAVLVGTEAVLHRLLPATPALGAGRRAARAPLAAPRDTRSATLAPALGAGRRAARAPLAAPRDTRSATLAHAPALRGVGLVAFLEFDQELLAPRVRAAEQALWLLARGARAAGGRSGGRLLVQTRVPDHEVLVAATTGDPAPLLELEAGRRRTLGFPPFGGLAELSGDPTAVADASARLRGRDGLAVLGPSAAGRTLLLAPSADALAGALASVDLAPARARGRLRVAVDPPRV